MYNIFSPRFGEVTLKGIINVVEQTLTFKTFRKVMPCSLEMHIHSVFVHFDIAVAY